MGNTFILANFDKKEYITFELSKEFEIIANKKSAQLVAYYFFENNGDSICFIGDQWQVGIVPLWAYGAGEFSPYENIRTTWKDATEEVLKELSEFLEEDTFHSVVQK